MSAQRSPVLSTLEPIGRRHIHAFQRLASDADVGRLCGFPTPFPERGAAMWIERSLRRRARGTEFSFAVLDCRRRLTGVCALTSVSPVSRSCSITYWVGKPFWGLGLATTAVNFVVAFGFENLGVECINARVFAHNRRSIRVLERSGFREQSGDTRCQQRIHSANSTRFFRIKADAIPKA